MKIYSKENLYPDGHVTVELLEHTGDLVLNCDQTQEAIALEPEAALAV